MKPQPKIYNLTIKTHKVAIFTTAPATATINSLKPVALSALQAEVLDAPDPRIDAMDEDDWKSQIPTSVDEFEFARVLKEKGRPTGVYEPLQGSDAIKSVLVNWDSLFIQFKDRNGECGSSSLRHSLFHITSGPRHHFHTNFSPISILVFFIANRETTTCQSVDSASAGRG